MSVCLTGCGLPSDIIQDFDKYAPSENRYSAFTARSGEAGTGFMVVAEEVRNLAIRAAGNIQELLNGVMRD